MHFRQVAFVKRGKVPDNPMLGIQSATMIVVQAKTMQKTKEKNLKN